MILLAIVMGIDTPLQRAFASIQRPCAATRIAARIGVILGTALMGLGVIWAIFDEFAGGLWWMLIGLFILSAASSAVCQEQMLRLFKGAGS